MTELPDHHHEFGAPLLLGVSHHNASLDLRESMAFAADETESLLASVAVERPVAEAAILSTCNRTEFYLAPHRDDRTGDRWLSWLTNWRPADVVNEFRRVAYRKTGPDAAQHLFRVAAGLDSSVLGDVEVQGQVKQAMRMASGAGVLRAQLNQVMTQALRAGKRARSETPISAGSPSVGSAVGRLLAERLAVTGLANPSITLVGSGKAARAIARVITDRWTNVTFTNRTDERARTFCQEFGGDHVPFGQLDRLLVSTDVLITATAACEPIVSRMMLDRADQARKRPLLVIDPSVPRNVETTASVDVIDIDSVRDERDTTLAVREQARDAAELIVLNELESWLQWSAKRPVEALIRKLYETADRQAAVDADRLGTSVDGLRGSYRQLLHDHVRELRSLVSDSHPVGPGGHHGMNDGSPEG